MTSRVSVSALVSALPSTKHNAEPFTKPLFTFLTIETGPDDEAERSHCKTTTARVSLRTEARVSKVNRSARLCVFIFFFLSHM